MKIFFSFCLTLLLCLKASAQGPPPHYLTGGEVYYTYQGMLNGEHVYRVTTQCYKKCDNPNSHTGTVRVSIFDRLTGVTIKSFSAPLNGTSVESIPADSLNNCLVNPPSACYIVAYYSFDISLPASDNGYLISCRPEPPVDPKPIYRQENIANLLEWNYVFAKYTAEIPGGTAAANSSFRISGDDVVVSCANSKFSYRFGATDYDGDELRYYLCDAYRAGLNADNYIDFLAPPPFQPVIYAPNFSGSMPLGSNVKVDEKSGLMKGIAPGEGSYVVTICVGEYRNAVLIATQRREVQIDIAPCVVTAASLLPEYMVCADNRTLQLSNLSSPFRVEQYQWQISSNDGTVLSTQTTPTISYNFADTGIYNIKLVINKDKECRDSTTSIARVYPGLKTDFSFSGICFGKPTSFSNNTTATYGQINYWKWDFGDGFLGNAAYGIPDVTGDFNPTYEYQNRGSKLAQLVVGTTKGCLDTLRKTIDLLAKPPMTLAFKDTLICLKDNVQLGANAPGGGNFSWTPANNMINSNSNIPTVSPVVTTTYYVLLDDNGCLNKDSVKVRVTDKVFLQAMNDTTICQGDSVQLKLVSDGFTYLWTNISTENAVLPSPITVANTTTLYEVTAFIGGCTAKGQVVVTAVPYPKADAGNDTTICFQTAAQLLASTDGSSISWSPASTLNRSEILNPIATPKETTSYVLSAFDTKGCPKAGKDTLVVTVPIKPFVNRDTAVIVGQPLQLNAHGGVTYRWSPAFGLSATDIANPVAVYSSPSEGIRYQVEMSQQTGCPDFTYLTVKVFATKAMVFVPNAFTPNGDGKNDKVRPIAAGMLRIEYFNVYNRWGKLVFRTQIDGHGWDGNISGQKQGTGVFVWAVKAVDYNGKPYFQKGTVTLIR